jgi:hypothetical protein
MPLTAEQKLEIVDDLLRKQEQNTIEFFGVKKELTKKREQLKVRVLLKFCL